MSALADVVADLARRDAGGRVRQGDDSGEDTSGRDRGVTSRPAAGRGPRTTPSSAARRRSHGGGPTATRRRSTTRRCSSPRTAPAGRRTCPASRRPGSTRWAPSCGTRSCSTGPVGRPTPRASRPWRGRGSTTSPRGTAPGPAVGWRRRSTPVPAGRDRAVARSRRPRAGRTPRHTHPPGSMSRRWRRSRPPPPCPTPPTFPATGSARSVDPALRAAFTSRVESLVTETPAGPCCSISSAARPTRAAARPRLPRRRALREQPTPDWRGAPRCSRWWSEKKRCRPRPARRAGVAAVAGIAVVPLMAAFGVLAATVLVVTLLVWLLYDRRGVGVDTASPRSPPAAGRSWC